MEALCDELAEFGTFHLYRPYNDMRFAKGRPPYKTHQGAFTRGLEGGGHYVQISADGLMAAAGYYVMAKDQLDRFRHAVDDPDLGVEIADLADGLVGSGYWMGAHETLKTAPRGFPKDHPPRRVAAAQGSDGAEIVAGRPVDARPGSDPAGAGGVADVAPWCLARSPHRAERAPLRPDAVR